MLLDGTEFVSRLVIAAQKFPGKEDMGSAVTLENAVNAWTVATPVARRQALGVLQGKALAQSYVATESLPIMVSAAGAARLASVSKPTIFRWSRMGILHPIEIAGQKRWARADLERLLTDGSHAAPMHEIDDAKRVVAVPAVGGGVA